MTAPAPCPECKCAVFFNRNKQPVCANCEAPGRHKLYMIVNLPEGNEWRVLEKEREEHEASLKA